MNGSGAVPAAERGTEDKGVNARGTGATPLRGSVGRQTRRIGGRAGSDVARSWADPALDEGTSRLVAQIFFAFDDARVPEQGRQVIAGLVEQWRRLTQELPDSPVGSGAQVSAQLVGHTDHLGPEGYNERLGLRRAQAVALEVMARAGPRVSLSEIRTDARSEGERYAAQSGDAAQRAHDRRVDIFASVVNAIDHETDWEDARRFAEGLLADQPPSEPVNRLTCVITKLQDPAFNDRFIPAALGGIGTHWRDPAPIPPQHFDVYLEQFRIRLESPAFKRRDRADALRLLLQADRSILNAKKEIRRIWVQRNERHARMQQAFSYIERGERDPMNIYSCYAQR